MFFAFLVKLISPYSQQKIGDWITELGKTCPKCGTFFLGNTCPKCGWEVLSVIPKPVLRKKHDERKIKGVFR